MIKVETLATRASSLTKTIRLLRVGMHIAEGLAVASAVFPLVSVPRRQALHQRWSRRLVSMLGVQLEVHGAARTDGLLVANHISWLDVFVISAIFPATFVCKSEVRAWPAIGSLCVKTGTIFIERGRSAAARITNEAVVAHLHQGRQIAVFPEGTTTDGSCMEPFRAAMLQTALDSGAVVQPLALRYLNAEGLRVTDTAYIGDTSFWESLCRIASSQGLVARIETLEPIATKLPEAGLDVLTRRHLAELAQRRILAALNLEHATELRTTAPAAKNAVSPAPTFATGPA